jgi:hypothetical protein
VNVDGQPVPRTLFLCRCSKQRLSWRRSLLARVLHRPGSPPPIRRPQTTIDHDGTFSVGTDIAAGTYSSPGPVAGGTCYWKRLGPDNAILDSALSLKPQVVAIDPTDKAFKTDGCQPWQKTDSATPEATPPPAGAAAQLRTYIDTLNSGARQFGGGQLPGP